MKLANIRKTIHYFQKNGIVNTYYAAKERLEQQKENAYLYREVLSEEYARQRKEGEDFTTFLSIVVPAYETKEEYLQDLIISLKKQSYKKFELILADASTSGCVKQIFEKTIDGDTEHFRYLKLSENKGISENTNRAILAARGDYICLVDHDDVLTKDALFNLAKAVETAGDIKPVLVYCDEDKGNSDMSYFYDYNDKYEFNYDLILSNNYICHITMVEANLMKQLLERGAYDGAQDYDLVLRVILSLQKKGVGINELSAKIIHIPKVLYHWRCHPDSTAENVGSKMYAYESGRRALEDYYQALDWPVEVTHSLHLGFYKTTYQKDIFSVRKDIGILAGRVLDSHNKMKPCIWKNGMPLYVGLHRRYSGKMHRFSLCQEIEQADIRCMRLAPELHYLTQKLWGIEYTENQKGFFDCSIIQHKYKLETETAWYEMGKTISKEVYALGKRIVYMPDMEYKDK